MEKSNKVTGSLYPECPRCGFMDQYWFMSGFDYVVGRVRNIRCNRCGHRFDSQFTKDYSFVVLYS